ncbi:MAG TPA: hypothetical protein V6C65_24180 [Allocoleopsis sp.]
MANIHISDLQADSLLISLEGDTDVLIKSAIDRALMARGGAVVSPVATKVLVPPIIAGFFPPFEIPSLETQILS